MRHAVYARAWWWRSSQGRLWERRLCYGCIMSRKDTRKRSERSDTAAARYSQPRHLVSSAACGCGTFSLVPHALGFRMLWVPHAVGRGCVGKVSFRHLVSFENLCSTLREPMSRE